MAGTVVEIAVGDALALRTTSLARREVLGAAAIAAAVGVGLAALGPPAGDAPAHLYRESLVREGVAVWDNLWYGGHYPLASYSLLAYLPAALVGSVVLAVAAAIASAALFARIAIEEWGEAARWPARAFAVCACAPLFTGTYAYGLGLAALLASLRAFQGGRRWLGILCAGLTLAFSPLAFAFLCLALLAVALTYRPSRRTWVLVGGWLAGFAGVQLAVNGLFPAAGRYDFRPQELAWALVACGLLVFVASRSPRGRVLALLFAFLGAACVAAFLVDSPLGSNITRFRALVFPLGLLVLALAGWRPRWLATACIALAAVYTFSPYAAVATGLTDTRAARSEFWQPALGFLRDEANPNYRVDVVPTFDNWEAYYVPQAGFALARGWYRQLDVTRNPVLYGELTAAEYRSWLRANGVRYVLLPHATLDRVAASAQAELLRSGRSGLVEVADGPDWTVYELPRATPILTGPGGAGLTAFDHERIAGWTRAPGSYLLRVRQTPYLTVSSGDVCLEPVSNGLTQLVARRAGPFELRVGAPAELVQIAFGARPAAC